LALKRLAPQAQEHKSKSEGKGGSECSWLQSFIGKKSVRAYINLAGKIAETGFGSAGPLS
jgi:hypothetical protein